MLHTSRRASLKLIGGAALAGALPLTAFAQTTDLVVPNKYQNFKRGTIHSMHPEVRSFTIVWDDLGRVKMKAADLVRNYPSLKVGQIVDTHWYDYLDFLIAKTTPAVTAQAAAMLQQGARLEGIPGMQEKIRLWTMSGMCTKTDGATVYLINASGGEPDKPSPNSGEVIQMPPVLSDAGMAAGRRFPPGDLVTWVFRKQTAIDATIIR
jgi:hypothetical protein